MSGMAETITLQKRCFGKAINAAHLTMGLVNRQARVVLTGGDND